LCALVEGEPTVDSLVEFLVQLPASRWFERIGEADYSMSRVMWLRTWHDWPGPEASRDRLQFSARSPAQQLDNEINATFLDPHWKLM
jgi:hypothetical protein